MIAPVPTLYLLSLTLFQKWLLKNSKQLPWASRMTVFFQHNNDFGYVIETAHVSDNQ